MVIIDGNTLFISFHIIGCKDENIPLRQSNLFVFEGLDPDSGPFVSSMMAIGSFSLSLTFLMSLFFARCSSCVPCQKFNRATFIPFLHIYVRISSSSQAGAMVQIILVFRIFQNTFLYYNSKADTLCGGSHRV